MMRLLAMSTLALLTAGCTQLPSTVPALVTKAATVTADGLAAYQAALGAAEQAEIGAPTINAKIQAIAAEAAPYIADAQSAAAQAGTAPTLAALSAELLLAAAPYIKVTPNAR